MRQGSLRQQIMDLLGQEEMNSLQISQAVGVAEKDVASHLEHISRTLARTARTLSIEPPACLGCGYIFKERKRLQRPGRCPRCKGSHIRMATYRIS
ncbi:MAG: transcriptional regulator [Desulfobulbaceae bacterium]|mgnify:FL=1|nr:MAG: transcriptional regulator [Desulfobulbaceae bacterium]